MARKFSTREEWLVAAVKALASDFEEIGAPLPQVRVSVGWPGGRGRKNSVIGQCWAGAAASDGVAQVFVSPVLDDVSQVLAVLVHELVHAVDECKSGHKGNFVRLAKAIGLEGPWTSTSAGESLTARLAEVAKDLGTYPHAALATVDGADGPKKQGTRMLKVACVAADEGEEAYVVRMTRKWLDTYGAPICPCHEERMEEVTD